MAMVEIRERSAEAAARVHLLVEELAVLVAQGRVRLVGQEAHRLAVNHAVATVAFAARVCARSMLSKSARKFP